MFLSANQTQDLQPRSSANCLAHPSGEAASSVSGFKPGVVDGEFAQIGESREVLRGVELLEHAGAQLRVLLRQGK